MIEIRLIIIASSFLFFLSTQLSAQSGSSQKFLEQGNSSFENMDYKSAVKAYQKSYEHKETTQALQGLVQSHFELGNRYQFNGDETNGHSHFSAALEYAEKLVSIDASHSEYRLMRGLMYHYNQEYENAKSDYEYVNINDPENGRAYYYLWILEPLEGLEKTRHPYVSLALDLDPELYEFYQELGSYYNSAGLTEEAIAKYEKAISISPKNYKANFALGQVYWGLGDLVKMRHHFSESLKYFPDFGYAKMSLAGVELMEANITAAIPLIRAALKDNSMTDQYLSMYIENFPELANYNFRGKEQNNEAPIDAEGYPKYFQEAIALAQVFDFYAAIDKLHACYDNYTDYEGAQPAWEISILAWLSHAYKEVGDYAKASQTAKKSLNGAIENNLTVDQASLTANLAIIYYNWGDYVEAINYANQSIRFLTANNQEDKFYEAYTNIGTYYRQWGVSDSAVYYHQLALEEASETNDLLKVALIKKELALSHSANMNSKQAQKLISDVKKIKKQLSDDSQDATLDLGIASVHYQSGEYRKALEYIEAATPHFLKLQEAVPGHPDIIPFVENYIGISTQVGNIPLAYDNFLAMNDVLYSLTKKFFPSMNEKGKLNYYREVKERFESFNSFVMHETNKPALVFEKMYENQLLIKGLLFNNAQKIQNKMNSSSDPVLQQQFDLLIQNKNQMARSITLSEEEKGSRGIDINSVQKSIDSLEVVLNQSGVEVSSNRFYEEGLVQKVRAQLLPGEAAVEIVRYRNYNFADGGAFTDQVNYLALILRGDREGVDYVLLPNANELESKHYRSYVNSISYEISDTVSYNAYWRSIQDKLSGIKKLYFAGDGIYHKININTLYDVKKQNYVIDQLDIRLVTSTKDILKKSPVFPRRGQITLVGFPTFELINGAYEKRTQPQSLDMIGTRAFTSIESLEPLPGTFSEVKTIEKIFEGTKWDTQVFTGESALEENIKALKDPTVLHIATHGYFEESEPRDNPLLYSGLFLSGASSNYKHGVLEGEDGVLTAYEAMHLNLTKTQMVVLSACETGMGRVENGDGVYGLQRAFLIAGAQSVIMSMWKVNDQTTMELMNDFYENLAVAKDKHVAFRQAQLRLREKYPNPKYWGAFNITGR